MPVKHALIVGVDTYTNLEQRYQLAGCVNDARLINKVLVDHFDFEPSRITEIHNDAATRDGILTAMHNLVDSIDAGDIVVFHFSGHGSRRTTTNPEKGTGMDSTIMPSDSGREPHPNLDIADDEIHEWLSKLTEKTSNVSLTFDCCHSGTITRDAFGAKARAVEADTRSLEEMAIDSSKIASRSGGKRGASGWLEISDAYVVMSGCRDDEFSYEFVNETGSESVKNGALTHFLVNALINAKPGSTYRDVYEIARHNVNAKFSGQHPQLEGAQDRQLFGVSHIEPFRYVPVTSVDHDSVTLGCGAAHGVSSQSIWTVFPPQTKNEASEDMAGTIEITSVGSLTSTGVIRESNFDIVPGSRCVERSPAPEQFKLPVDLSELNPEERATIGERIDQSDLLVAAKNSAAEVRLYIVPARNQTDADSPAPQLNRVDEASWVGVDLEGSISIPPKPVTQQKALDTVIENLESRARYRNALALNNRSSNLDVAFNIYKLDQAGKPESSDDGNMEFCDGDCLAFEIVNNSAANVFVSVLDFGLTGKISLIFPPNSTSELIGPGESIMIGAGDRKLRLRFPSSHHAERGTEFVSALISSDEADFRWLQQPGMRSTESGRSILQRQFESAYLGTSFREIESEGPEEDADWTAIVRAFDLRKREI